MDINGHGRTFTGAQGRKWLGGFVRVGADGKETFVIEKKVGGRKFKVSTQCHSQAAALKEYARWELDPEGYVAGATVADRLLLTPESVDGYVAWQTSVLKNDPEHVANMRRCLVDWAVAIKGRDLRSLRLDFFEAALAPEANKARDKKWGAGSRRFRIMAIKNFYKFLSRDPKVMSPQFNGTLSLRIPQPSPEQWVTDGSKAAAEADLRAVFAVVEQPTRDVLHLKTGTGWHTSEVRRFVENGAIILHAKPLPNGEIAQLRTIQKNGEPINTPLVLPEHLAAAERLLSLRAERINKRGKKIRGLPDKTWLAKQMRRACAKATEVRDQDLPEGAPRPPAISVQLDQIRSTFLSWAIRDGATLEATSAAAVHKDKETTRRFYLAHGRATHAPVPVTSLAAH